MQAVFHTDIRLDDHSDREREKYVSDLLPQSSDKDKDKDKGSDKYEDKSLEQGKDSHDLARQLLHIGERSSVGRNPPLGI